MKIFVCVLVAIVAGANALYSASDDVVELTPANFNKQVLQGDELWLVEFYAPWCGHCKSLAPEWKKAASALKGIAKVGAVDMDQHQSLGGPYNVKGFPTIKVFGLDKKSAKDYQGARQAQGIVDAAMTHIRQMASDRLGGKSGGKKSGGSGGGGGKTGDTKDVVELTDSNFDEEVLQTDELVLVEFFAPWCGHCKSLAPEWASAATQLKGKVKVAALDATVHTITGNRYGIEAYPTILFFQANKEDEILLYDGGLSTEDIVTFGQEFFAMIQPPPDVYEVRGYPTIKAFLSGKKDGEAVDYDGGRSASDIVAWALDKFTENIPPPEVNELTSQEVLKTACDDHQLCIISVLPHILDCQSQCRNNYISMLKTLADKYKKRQWGYVWCEAGSQPSVEEALGIGGFGYPAMAAVNSRKMKFSLMKGSFSETGINEYLRALSVGRGSTSPLSNLPEVQNTEAWDGKDGELPVEEEWDLSDVELDDLDPLEKIEL